MTAAGKRILAGLEDALAYSKGDHTRGRAHRVRVDAVDVAAVRKRLGLTQREFAEGFKISLGTLRHWEQGVRRPDGPARVLLAVIDKDPEHVIKAIWPAKVKRAA